MSTKKLTKEEILHLAKLAKLTLTEVEIDTLRDQFNETLSYIKNLDELDTTNVQPTNSVVNLSNVTFEDGEKNDLALNEKDLSQNGNNFKNSEFSVDRIQ